MSSPAAGRPAHYPWGQLAVACALLGWAGLAVAGAGLSAETGIVGQWGLAFGALTTLAGACGAAAFAFTALVTGHGRALGAMVLVAFALLAGWSGAQALA